MGGDGGQKTQIPTTTGGIQITECLNPSHGHTTLHKLKRKPSDTVSTGQRISMTLSLTHEQACRTTREIQILRDDVWKLFYLPTANNRYKRKKVITYYKIFLVLQKKKKFRGQQGKRPTDVNVKDFYISKSILTRTTGLHFPELLGSLWFQSFSQ